MNNKISQLSGMEFLKTLKQQRIPCSTIAFNANSTLDEVLQVGEQASVPAKFIRAYRQHISKQQKLSA